MIQKHMEKTTCLNQRYQLCKSITKGSVISGGWWKASIQPYKHSIAPYDAATHDYQTHELIHKIA